jgi:hypothetical protein
LGTADTDPEKPIGKTIKCLGILEEPEQLLPGDMDRKGNVCASGASRAVFGQRSQVSRIPTLTKDRREAVSITLEHFQYKRKFTLIGK